MKKFIAFFLCAAMLISMSACAKNTDNGEGTTDAETIDLSLYEVEYPVTVTDHLEREVTVSAAPAKIVSTYSVATDYLIALGADDKLVGIEEGAADKAIYKKAASALTVLPAVTVDGAIDVEAVKALDADLVIISADQGAELEAVDELGAVVIAIDPASISGTIETIVMLGKATNTVYYGQKIQEKYFSELADIGGGRLEEEETVTAYYAGEDSVLNVAGSAMYENVLLENACLENVAAELTDESWSETTYDQILVWDPDYIIIASDAEYTAEDVLADEALAECTAVKNGNVYKIPSDVENWDEAIPAGFLGSLWLAAKTHPTKYTIVECNQAMRQFYSTFYGFTPENYN